MAALGTESVGEALSTKEPGLEESGVTPC